MRARLDVVRDWLRAQEPDVLALQETKVVDELFPVSAFQALGFHSVFRGMKGYNGVALLSRQPPDTVAFGFSREPRDDPRLLHARFGDLHIVNTYVPQGRALDHPMFAYKVNWFDRLRRWFESRFAPTDAVLWVGDLNVAAEPIDVHNPEDRADHVCFHAAARRAFARARAWGFEDVFRLFHPEPGHYTFFDYRQPFTPARETGWRLDYILATAPIAKRARVCRIDPRPRGGPRPSDHVPVLAVFED